MKGCCCKRSQCIKNYCDCYQSMVICSKFCRCVGKYMFQKETFKNYNKFKSGCRNTEVRKAVDSSTPAKNSSAAKREKAAAMSAKAAAAAAKAGIHVPMKHIPGSGPGVPGKPFGFPPGQIPAAIPMNINKKSQQAQLAAAGREGIPITRPHLNGPASVRAMKAAGQPQSVGMVNPVKMERQHPNFFSQPVNAALLECVLVQATEAEQMGFNDVQVGQLILLEFMRGVKAIYEATCEHNITP
ncbi:hypothetical protein KR067_009561 [Drosophila pandora]|nr:hypothetical protein KR067_009561 [Drosophila pandora]